MLAEPVAPAGAVASRSPRDLALLMEMDQPPAISVPAASTTKPKDRHKKKLPEKDDVTQIGRRRVDRGVNLYSLDKEQAIGKQMAGEIESQCRIVEDPVVVSYIRELGLRLARNSDAKVPFTIKVIDSDEVNAFALPGGYLYVNTGLILAAQNESELAAVMAHEIAHVAARHATRNMTKEQLWNIASIPMIFFGGPIGMALRQVSSIALPMSINKFSRDAEREADLLGIQYGYAAGYDPVSFVNLFERLKAGETRSNFIAKAFATHPMNRDRIQRAEKEIATMLPARDEYIVDTSRFQDVRQHLLGVTGEMPFLHKSVTKENRPVLNRRTIDNVPQAPEREEPH